jgi:hypothetical protein
MMRRSLQPLVCLSLLGALSLANAGDYYVSPTGDDANSGTLAAPWRSVARVNDAELRPGDCVHFRGGGSFAGTVELGRDDSGTSGEKIIVTSYGEGRAVIDGANGSGLRAKGCDHLVVRDLNFVGSGRKSGNTQDGVCILDSEDVQINRVAVSGFRSSGLRLDGVSLARITDVYTHDNGFAGLSVGYGKRSKDVYLGRCVARNNPGDPSILNNHSGNGIVVGNAEKVTIEYCEAANNGWDMPRKGNGPVGIWAWNSDRVVIQFCSSHDNKSPGDDGGGFDLDGGVTNSVLQYNLSYHNDGPGYFLCQYPGAPDFKDNIVRYNISQDDGVKNNRRSGIDVFSASANASSCQVYNNTVYNSRGAAVGFGGLPMPDVVFRNNIFVCSGDALAGEARRGRFEGNVYWSADGRGLFFDGHRTLREWAEATGQEEIGAEIVGKTIDPRLTGPGTAATADPATLAALAAYKLMPDSPCIGAGVIIKDNGGRDFWGNRVSEFERPALGACERP